MVLLAGFVDALAAPVAAFFKCGLGPGLAAGFGASVLAVVRVAGLRFAVCFDGLSALIISSQGGRLLSPLLNCGPCA